MSDDLRGALDELVLIAVLRKNGDGYGVSLRQEVSRMAGRTVAYSAVYASLNRLEDLGFISSREGAPTPERGGRAKQFYAIKAQGVMALQRRKEEHSRIWDLEFPENIPIST